MPLARLFSTKYPVVGFDIDSRRVARLSAGHDDTLEMENGQLRQALDSGLRFTGDPAELADCSVFIVTVPTPVDRNNEPDLAALKEASRIVGGAIGPGGIVVYESTVYPGVTEDVCAPIVEQVSGMEYNKDFFVGYSPERVSPGDKARTVEKILKITSGSTPETAEKVDELYRSVIGAGTYKAPSIKVAEAAKVIENSQRDLNIAFMNELSKMFARMGLDTGEVLAAASTKWNFLPFRPGLVGGHCIGVDPYYLVSCSRSHGYDPGVIAAARRINDSMGDYVGERVAGLMLENGIETAGSEILVLGFTFKENCADTRNTRVGDIVKTLCGLHANVAVYDPWADPAQVKSEYGFDVLHELPGKKYDAVVLAVAHDRFRELDVRSLGKDKSVVYDVKGFLPAGTADARL